MGCLVNLIKIFLGLILIVIMLIVGYKLIFDPSTFQKPGVEMELTPELERGLVYVIKVFKAVFGQDKCVISILSTHEEFYSIQKKRKRLRLLQFVWRGWEESKQRFSPFPRVATPCNSRISAGPCPACSSCS